MVSPAFPVAGPVLPEKLEPRYPLGGLVGIEARDDQPDGKAVLGRQRFALEQNASITTSLEKYSIGTFVV